MPYKDRQQQVDYQNRCLRARRLAWISENGPCRQCGSEDGLEVDHIDPNQKFTHRIWSYTKSKRDAELAKCQVLCSSCHKKKTKEQRRPPFVHGTIACYRFYQCKCLPCKAANALRKANFIRKQKEARAQSAI